MDSAMREVHARLEQWMKWANDNPGAWPRRTLLGRMIDKEMISHAAAPPVIVPASIAITDQAVASLTDIDKRVIRTYYGYWEPLAVICKRLRMGRRECSRALNRARLRVSDQIKRLEL